MPDRERVDAFPAAGDRTQHDRGGVPGTGAGRIESPRDPDAGRIVAEPAAEQSRHPDDADADTEWMLAEDETPNPS